MNGDSQSVIGEWVYWLASAIVGIFSSLVGSLLIRFLDHQFGGVINALRSFCKFKRSIIANWPAIVLNRQYWNFSCTSHNFLIPFATPVITVTPMLPRSVLLEMGVFWLVGAILGALTHLFISSSSRISREDFRDGLNWSAGTLSGSLCAILIIGIRIHYIG
jgi:hypothetical protein